MWDFFHMTTALIVLPRHMVMQLSEKSAVLEVFGWELLAAALKTTGRFRFLGVPDLHSEGNSLIHALQSKSQQC
jgi:hypothetical protein